MPIREQSYFGGENEVLDDVRVIVTDEKLKAFQEVGPRRGATITILNKAGEVYIRGGTVGKGEVYVRIDSPEKDLGDFWREVEEVEKSKS